MKFQFLPLIPEDPRELKGRRPKLGEIITLYLQ